MLETLKRWFRLGTTPVGWNACAVWAREQGHVFRSNREGDGLVIETADGAARQWRLEWGASQRPYIEGAELRIRAEMSLPAHLQCLVVSRMLMESLEKTVYEQFTHELQTRADTDTPEEMRWLVLYPKLNTRELHGLKSSFGAVGNLTGPVALWLEGALARRLLEARQSWLRVEDPLVLMVHRGRLTLRAAMPTLDEQRLPALASLFGLAQRELLRMAEALRQSGDVPSTMPGLWEGDSEAEHSRP